MKSHPPSRFGAFFSRVETEREVLSIINNTCSDHKLHGLTGAAIDRWALMAAATAPGGREFVEEAVRLLHRISIRCDTHADQSRVVFAGETSVMLPVHDLVEKLRTVCYRSYERSDYEK